MPDFSKDPRFKNPKDLFMGDDGMVYHNAIYEKGDVIPLQELNNITDHRTIGEIQDDEKEQWRVLHAFLSDFRFDTKPQAKFFLGQCMMYTFKKLGASREYLSGLGKGVTREELEKRLYADHRIRIAKHRKSQHDETWQAGTYIYYDKELISFISDPEYVKSEFILTVPFWLVRTNIKLPGGKGVISVPH